MKKLFINPEPCTSCMSCMAACAQRRAGAADLRASSILVADDPFGGAHRLTVCRQCNRAACAAACPEGAIVRDESLGIWVIRHESCVRCGTCVKACPFASMFWWSDEQGPVKCDLCGGDPRCARACHFGVIRFAEPTDPLVARKGIPEEDLDPLLGRGAP